MSPIRQGRSGFTLIELLVVIDIIVVLSAILFPAFATAREKARQISCLSGEQQIGLAFQQYVQDNDDNYPTPVETHYLGYGWAGKVFPYVKNAQVFHCPDDPTGTQTNTVGGKAYTLSPVSYAYNAALGIETHYYGSTPYGFGIGGASPRLNAPAKTVLLLEVGGRTAAGTNVADLSTPGEAGGASGTLAGGAHYSPSFVDSYTDNSGAAATFATGYMGGSQGAYRQALLNSSFYLSPTGRHSAGANYLLCDGHAKWLKSDQVSTGEVRVGTFPDPSCNTQEAQGQDPPGSCAAFLGGVQPITPAGTGSSEHWAATWSPI